MRHQTHTIQKKNNQLSQKRKDFLEAIKDFKDRQAKDKRSPKKAMGTLQAIDSFLISSYLLHLWAESTFGFKSSHGSLMEQGFTWSLSKVRHKGTPTTVLQLQYKPRRNGGRLLRKNVKGNRARSNGSTPKRPASKRKGSSTLSKPHPKLPKNFGKFTEDWSRG